MSPAKIFGIIIRVFDLNFLGWLILILMIVGGILLGFSYFVAHYLRKCLTPLLSIIDGQIRVLFLRRDPYLEGKWEGKKFKIGLSHHREEGYVGSGIHICFYHNLSFKFPFQIYIKREGRVFSSLKRAKIFLKKINADDSQFYESYCVLSDDELNARNLLNPKRIQIIEHLFEIERGNVFLEITENFLKLNICWTGWSCGFFGLSGFKERLSPNKIIETLRVMIKFIEEY